MSSSIQDSINEAHQYEALFINASMGIIILHNNGTIQSVNPFALNFFGYTNEELTDRPIEILIPRRFHTIHVEHRTEFSNKYSNRPMGAGMDLYAIRKDGSEFPVEVSLGKYRLNREDFIIAFVTDITVRKKAEAEIIKLNDQLEETVQQRTVELTHTLHQLEYSKEELSKSLEKEKELGELKSRFVSMASHEFRTPLSTILSSAYLLEKYTTTDDQPKREKHLQRIFSSVNTLTDILNDFLSLGKIEEGKIQVRSIHFNVADLVKIIISEMENNLKKQQRIRYSHEGNKEVFLDASLMKHIVMNLLSNASKFSFENSDIEINTFTATDQFILSIKDHGIGISPDDQKHLMERFFRGANAGNIQGTGLGLHIVSKYAELMNGTVDCKSELEKGTEFIITFNTKIS